MWMWSVLMTEAETVSEMPECNSVLTWLKAQEDCTSCTERECTEAYKRWKLERRPCSRKPRYGAKLLSATSLSFIFTICTDMSVFLIQWGHLVASLLCSLWVSCYRFMWISSTDRRKWFCAHFPCSHVTHCCAVFPSVGGGCIYITALLGCM